MRVIGPLGADIKTLNKWENICLGSYSSTLIFPTNILKYNIRRLNKETLSNTCYTRLLVYYSFLTLSITV